MERLRKLLENSWDSSRVQGVSEYTALIRPSEIDTGVALTTL